MASETQAEVGSTAVALQPPSDVAAVRSDVVHLRSFPVVYRWNMGRSSQSGTVKGVEYQQTMGRMVLMYPLEDNVDEDDLKVEMSCWELKVSKSGSQIPALCQETYDDIHRDISWWKVEAPKEKSNERFLLIYLAKANHRPWTSPWFDGPLNYHKKQLFAWHELQGSRDVLKGLKIDSESLKTIEPGEPEDWNHEISTAMTPEQICTGIDIMESENMVQLMIHLNEEALDGATARVPLEEVFAADVSPSEVWVFLRGDSFTLCNGRLAHPVRPAQSSWQIRSVRRKNLPEGCNVKAPAFYNPALLISLVKESSGTWDKVFQDFHHCNYGMPRDRIEWSERVQRCMVLLPGAPNNKVGKASRAQALVKRVEATQHSLLNRIIILFHLEDKLTKLCESHRVSMHDLFTLMIGERSVQLNFVADSEYAMCWGGLGGACIPHSASMEIFMDGEESHPVLKLGLAKAENSKGKWEEVFKQMQPCELYRALLEDCQRPPELALEDDDQDA